MAKIFLSYAREDVDAAKQLAGCIASAGHEVWWDRHIQGGSRFTDEIDRALKDAEAVVVLWSEASVASAWVQDEAAEGRDSGRLVPVALGQCRPPLGFRQFHTIELGQWDGRGEPQTLGEVMAAIGKTASPSPAAPAAAPTTKVREHKASICVLPFVNMSGDPEQEYFSDGISEDIITDLSKVSALSVVARNTAFNFKGQSLDVKEVASSLGVSHVLEGSVRKAGSRVRVTAQLINGASGDHVWAERYDRDLDDIFAIQDEISKAIVAALKVKLLPAEKKAIEQRGTLSAEAYNLYLLARQYWVTGNHGDIRREERVMRICSRAVEIDPQYGRAWALLANAQSNLRYTFGSEVDDGFAAAHAALSIDPTIAEAHCAIARRFEEQGRHAEALAEIETALRLDPDSWEVNKEGARIFMARSRVADAQRLYDRTVELMESDFHAWAMVATCARDQGQAARVKQAATMMVSQSQKALEQDPSNGAALGILAGGFAILGQRDRANEMIERALLIDPDNSKMRYNFACILANYLEEKDEAIKLLATTVPFANRALVSTLMCDPDMDPLRDDPRFAAIMQSVKKRLGIEDVGA